jgi:uncharacterized protein YecE (DUF72 family)
VTGRTYIGTSGWNYRSWKESFYAGIPQKDWLHFCAERFSAIEVNATFYRLQEKKTFARWRDETPAHFRFAIKGNRYLTHNKKLADPLPSIGLERERAKTLGNKLAAVVWQMPHRFRKDIDPARWRAGRRHAMRSSFAIPRGSMTRSPSACTPTAFPCVSPMPRIGRCGMR